MCPKGSELYIAWTRLVPQIAIGRYDLLSLMKEKSKRSEAARMTYEKHWAGCKVCQDEYITATEYAAIQGWKE